jgi:uncharacterized integral membrane protein (TIGR00697 family)
MKKKYKYLGLITCLYITFQLVSDVTAGKLIDVLGFPVSATVLFFPITYIFADILTEVYGYANSRNVLWTVMICSILAGIVYTIVVGLTPSQIFTNNEAYSVVLGQVPRVLIGGWLAVFLGDITNNFALAKLKIITSGKYLWLRTISSTIIGELVNTSVFYFIGLFGVLPFDVLFSSIVSAWLIKGDTGNFWGAGGFHANNFSSLNRKKVGLETPLRLAR